MRETVGMILCGGYGTRLKPITDEIPKGLIEIKKDYTVLDKQIFDLACAGIKKTFLLTGFMGEKIEDHFNSEKFGIEIECIKEESPLGTLSAIRQGMECIGDKNYIIRNGDVVTDFNIAKMTDDSSPLALIPDDSLPLNMFITPMESPYGIVRINDERIVSFIEKPILNDFINGGIYYSRGELDFSKYKDGDIERTLFPEYARKKMMGYYMENGVLWKSIDTIKDLKFVKGEYRNKTDKPWGYEKEIIRTESYLTKELFIREGECTSMHFHELKDETMLIQSGRGYMEFEIGCSRRFEEGDKIRILPNTIHSIVAEENTRILEVSTPHVDDTLRVHDPYPFRV